MAKTGKILKQFMSYFPSYSTATLERFIESNNMLIEMWRKEIAEIEHENSVIQGEITRRQNIVVEPFVEIDVNAIDSVMTSTAGNGIDHLYLLGEDGKHTVRINESHPCFDAIFELIEEWPFEEYGKGQHLWMHVRPNV